MQTCSCSCTCHNPAICTGASAAAYNSRLKGHNLTFLFWSQTGPRVIMRVQLSAARAVRLFGTHRWDMHAWGAGQCWIVPASSVTFVVMAMGVNLPPQPRQRPRPACMLHSNRDRLRTLPYLFGCGCSWLGRLAHSGGSQLGLGVYVSSCRPEGPAAVAGLLTGDQVFEINGESLLP